MPKIVARKTMIKSILMRSEAGVLEELAKIETMLNKPEEYDDVQSLVEQSLDRIKQREDRYAVLKKYFDQQPEAESSAPPLGAEELQKRSPTYRNSEKNKETEE